MTPPLNKKTIEKTKNTKKRRNKMTKRYNEYQDIIEN